MKSKIVCLIIFIVMASPACQALGPSSVGEPVTSVSTQETISQSTVTAVPAEEIQIQQTAFPVTEITDDFGIPMVLVPAGEFTMGSENGRNEERPVHQVDLDAFYMDTYEVTNAAYEACVGAGVCDPPQNTSSNTRDNYYGNSQYDDYPVIYVDWNQSQTYCEWRGGSLPTEAQWEKAARGTDGRTYPWGEEISCDQANYYDGSYCVGDTTEVGSYEGGKSPYGIYDLAGNVWEWTADWYDAYPGNTVSDSDYGTKYRVVRGGDWRSRDGDIRSASRIKLDPTATNERFGFRCVKDAQP